MQGAAGDGGWVRQSCCGLTTSAKDWKLKLTNTHTPLGRNCRLVNYSKPLLICIQDTHIPSAKIQLDKLMTIWLITTYMITYYIKTTNANIKYNSCKKNLSKKKEMLTQKLCINKNLIKIKLSFKFSGCYMEHEKKYHTHV